MPTTANTLCAPAPPRSLHHMDADRLSRKLSWLLRHNALKEGLPMGPDGYVPVDILVRYLDSHGFRGAHARDVDRAVADCPKRRFELTVRDGMSLVRATQGHTVAAVDDELLLTLVTVRSCRLTRPARGGGGVKAWGRCCAVLHRVAPCCTLCVPCCRLCRTPPAFQWQSTAPT